MSYILYSKSIYLAILSNVLYFAAVKNRIHVLRAERRWTQAELARQLHVSRQTINALETEKYDPSLQLAFNIARLFGRPLEEVFLDRENDQPHSGPGRAK